MGPKAHFWAERFKREAEVTCSGKNLVKQQDKVSTLFFKNFPDSCDEVTLTQTFAIFGKICGVFVAKRRTRWGSRFGFVKFCDIDTRKVIGKLDGIWLGSFKLRVNLAKYERGARFVETENRGRRDILRNKTTDIEKESRHVADTTNVGKETRSFADIVKSGPAGSGNKGRGTGCLLPEKEDKPKAVFNHEDSRRDNGNITLTRLLKNVVSQLTDLLMIMEDDKVDLLPVGKVLDDESHRSSDMVSIGLSKELTSLLRYMGKRTSTQEAKEVESIKDIVPVHGDGISNSLPKLQGGGTIQEEETDSDNESEVCGDCGGYPVNKEETDNDSGSEDCSCCGGYSGNNVVSSDDEDVDIIDGTTKKGRGCEEDFDNSGDNFVEDSSRKINSYKKQRELKMKKFAVIECGCKNKKNGIKCYHEANSGNVENDVFIAKREDDSSGSESYIAKANSRLKSKGVRKRTG